MFLCGWPKDAAAAHAGSLPANPLPSVPCRRRPANIDPGSTPPSSARVVCFGEGVAAWDASCLGPQFDEAGRCEVAIEGECLFDSPGPHEGKAGRVDERVLALVVPAEPEQRFVFRLRRRPLCCATTSSAARSRSRHGHDWWSRSAGWPIERRAGWRNHGFGPAQSCTRSEMRNRQKSRVVA